MKNYTVQFTLPHMVLDTGAWILASVLTQNIAYAMVGILLNGAVGAALLFTGKN